MQKIVIGDIIFPNTHIVACKDLQDVPFQLILSATMFQNLIYEIDDKNHKFNVTIPDDESNIRISESKIPMADCIFCAILPENSLVYRNSIRKIRFSIS